MARSPRRVRSDENQATAKELIHRYARQMIIEQRLAEIIRSFCAGALSSTVNLNVDLDIMLAIVAQALLAALRTRLPAAQSRPQAPSSARSWKPRPDPYCRLWLTGSPRLQAPAPCDGGQ
jgi:hypothetical protein